MRREIVDREHGVGTLSDNRRAGANANFIIPAVKSQNLLQVIEEIKTPSPEQLVLSIGRGAALSSLCQGFNHSPLCVKSKQ